MTLQPNENFSKTPRNPSRSFYLKYDNEVECVVCFEVIELGSLCHYNPDGLIVHHHHHAADKVGKPCPQCWLVHAGECGE